MANLAAVLKSEIRRLARSEAREVTAVTRRAAAQHRRDIAELKRKVASLERKVALLEKRTWRETPAAAATSEDTENLRFSAKGLASRRKKLGLSGAEYATLLGVSTQTLYNWEQGRSKPRKEQLVKLAALRTLSKREAEARLEQLG
jgi:DNA-binding transcriptional regulator YiaG